MPVIRLLIADDYEGVREALKVSLSKMPDLEVSTADNDMRSIISSVEGLASEVVLFEPKSHTGNVYETCRRVLSASPKPVVIVHTSYRDEQEALIMAELGVCRYLLKDIDSRSLYQEILACHAGQHSNT